MGDAMTFTISTHWMPDAAMVIQPEGPLESSDASQLTDRVVAVLAATKPEEILVDLAAVPSIDDAGVGALVSGYDQAAARDARLVVVAARPNVRQLLRTHGLGDLLTRPVPQPGPR
jgi:anti-anti-sigma factor